MTRELAIGMMRQADTGADMLTVAEAVASLSAEMNVESVARDIEAEAEAETDIEEANDPMDDFNYVGSPAHY
ncbi:hypothetical protein SCRM01_273 [Synechococcus phage S-CRM01]|uniref:hypothetical protein n=1 Tax=Synechococcus phage S-CRM01 TaxID=1026955 RepID=UPI000209E30D|nr:hypothetical protein SCRM01_273 [Synechococcus phage S-CRM01]AEC53219.1 hypothetical protein SCRM01_273 [Synechococcus phage S-CRM01]